MECGKIRAPAIASREPRPPGCNTAENLGRAGTATTPRWMAHWEPSHWEPPPTLEPPRCGNGDDPSVDGTLGAAADRGQPEVDL